MPKQSRRFRTETSVVAILLVLLIQTFALQQFSMHYCHAFHAHYCPRIASKSKCTRLLVALSPEEQALERTKQHLLKLQRNSKRRTTTSSTDDATTSKELSKELEMIESKIQEYLRLPANTIKEMLRDKGLPTKGRKPDLSKRLVEYEWQLEHGRSLKDETEASSSVMTNVDDNTTPQSASPANLINFCGLSLSPTASRALGTAQFTEPTPIQARSIPLMARGESVILHAATGSGKTLAYLLPITEAIWQGEDDDEFAMILTPTRELAAQVAGVASVLAPPGTVRLVTHPTNLMSDQQYWRERRGRSVNDPDRIASLTQQEDASRRSPRLLVGSAKAIMHSLYGDGKMPASPTRKPAAKELLSKTRWVVLDEVDRLLLQQGNKGNSVTKSQHEKPAAIVTSAVARRTLGRAQVIAASATVGRTLKRELSRILGLPPKEYPRVIRGGESTGDDEDDDDVSATEIETSTGHVGRAVTIPATVENYVVPVDASSVGNVLTNAFLVLKALNEGEQKGKRKILMVLTKGCGISTQNAIGALKHFRCQPEPMSLLDVLQAADGTDQLMEVHRQVSGSTGVGETSSYFQNEIAYEDNSSYLAEKRSGYLLITGEDSVRGLHLDGLDVVVVVGRPRGPDEYTHIAGRTGRAGRSGKVINVLNQQHATAVRGWEKMLNVEFSLLEIDDIRALT
ncbi:ATP-dependent RNA helicase [Nitzschia inconspicua]|uniref:ATP-dependent RNA helicase n=1 Tax=Nitzschia inconspicua TaxID=303405 RepID=A0A9K3PPH8_9STRA|nr:ATP-dependent RNA helicase [Nitzschia inconspicua]